MNWPYAGFIARRVRISVRELAWTHLLTAGTMGMTLFVFGGFLLLQDNLQQLFKGWGEQIQMHAYLQPGLRAADVQALLRRVENFPEVAAARFVSQEQAWRDFQASLGAQSGVLEGLPRDVLPASFEIAVRPEFRHAAMLESLAARIRDEQGIASVEYPQAWVERLNLVLLAVEWAKWLFGGILFLAAFFIIGSTVRLAVVARKDEIEIMQLVGAPDALIQAPFVVEGMLQGLAGAGLAIGGLLALFFVLGDQIASMARLLGAVAPLRFLQAESIALIVSIGWLLGASGSLFSLRRFVKT
ncbi:MAG TPA: permease-like cell division protein FtsX [Candidatus Eisenbacteria bacterium]|nr:permease-like cell division protein FtsX [Candidatus Eisenbacteria bacterium]